MNRIPPKPDINSTETCWHGLLYGTQLAVHFMRQNPTPGGCIVATGSSVGIHPIEAMPEYCGAKAAVRVSILSFCNTDLVNRSILSLGPLLQS